MPNNAATKDRLEEKPITWLEQSADINVYLVFVVETDIAWYDTVCRNLRKKTEKAS